MPRLLIPLLLTLLSLGGCYKPASDSQALGSAKNPIIMAFVPSTEAEKVVSSGEELCELLAAQTGLSFDSMVATSYVGIVEAMAADKVQVGWLPPLAYVFANQRNGDQAVLKVVRHGKSTYRGEILVLADSGIESIADLKGKRIAYPEQASTSGHLYPSTLLIEAGLDPEVDLEENYSGSHDAAVLALIKGSADAACCFDDARTKLSENGFEDIFQTTRVLAYTPEIPADNVSVTRDLDPELIQRITDGLLAVAATDEGARVLMELYEVEGLEPATDADYEPVRNMARTLGMDIEAELD